MHRTGLQLCCIQVCCILLDGQGLLMASPFPLFPTENHCPSTRRVYATPCPHGTLSL